MGEQLRRHVEAERLGDLEINTQRASGSSRSGGPGMPVVHRKRNDRSRLEMAQHEPVARIEALYRDEWPGSAITGLYELGSAEPYSLPSGKRLAASAVRS